MSEQNQNEPLVKPYITPRRLTASRARSMAACRWGRDGVHAYRTNTVGAYYFDCPSHGGYIVDGAILTKEQRAEIDKYVQPEMVNTVIRGDVTDYMVNPWNMRAQSYRSKFGQQIVEHPIYTFEHDCDWAVLEKFTPIRVLATLNKDVDRQAHIDEQFERVVLLKQRLDEKQKSRDTEGTGPELI